MIYYIFFAIRFIAQFIVLYIIADSLYYYQILPRNKAQKTGFKRYNKLLYTIFVLIPKRMGEYLQYLSSKEFSRSGLILFCGAQGEGKTYSMIHQATLDLCEFPDMKIFSNLWTIFSDGRLDDWKPLIYEKNGEKGIAFLFDEISLWWNSRFRDLPPDVLQELVQNRKNHRVIYGTCQSISMCDRQIRLQASEYRNCHCLFGFFIFCTCWRPVFDFDGNLSDKKFLGIKIYIQDDVIRESYDTFETISRLAKTGFNYEKPIDININMGVSNENKKKKIG